MIKPRLAGFLYADAWATYNADGEYYEVGFQQSLSNKPIYVFYRNSILDGFNGYYRERIRGNKLELKIYSKNLYSEVLEIKNKPITYLNMNHREFIAGILDGDGTITMNEIAIYNANKELLEEICIWLKSKGIKCLVKPCRHIWRIRIRSFSSIKKFTRLIPTLKPLNRQIKLR